jgi:hypothetical protein
MSNPPNTNWLNIALLAGYSTSKHYLHISIAFSDHTMETVANNQVQQVINSAEDWLRYASNCWIVWTGESPEQWYKKIIGISLLKNASMLVLKVDLSPTNRYGQFPPWVWEWIDKQRPSSAPSSQWGTLLGGGKP